MSHLLSGCLSCRLLSNERLPQFDELLLGVIERLPSICLKPIKRPHLLPGHGQLDLQRRCQLIRVSRLQLSAQPSAMSDASAVAVYRSMICA